MKTIKRAECLKKFEKLQVLEDSFNKRMATFLLEDYKKAMAARNGGR
jgi:hypothetical protein